MDIKHQLFLVFLSRLHGFGLTECLVCSVCLLIKVLKQEENNKTIIASLAC